MRPITDAQRGCVAHAVRDIAIRLEAAITGLENPESVVSARELYDSLSGAAADLQRMAHQLKNGSFCLIPNDQCDFVSRLVGCDPARRDGTIVSVRTRRGQRP